MRRQSRPRSMHTTQNLETSSSGAAETEHTVGGSAEAVGSSARAAGEMRVGSGVREQLWCAASSVEDCVAMLTALLRLALLTLAASLLLEFSRLSVVRGENTGWLGLRSWAFDTRGAVPCGFKLPRRSELLTLAVMELRGGA